MLSLLQPSISRIFNVCLSCPKSPNKQVFLERFAVCVHEGTPLSTEEFKILFNKSCHYEPVLELSSYVHSIPCRLD